MSVALHGNLQDFGIGEVFQLIGQQRKTGVLDVELENARIHVRFSEGSVVTAVVAGPHTHAALGDRLVRAGLLSAEQLVAVERDREQGGDFQKLLIRHSELSADQIEDVWDLVTQETLFQLLRASSGSFHFRSETVRVERDPARLLPAEQILMDGLRMVDEWRTLDPVATDSATVLERRGRFEAFRELVGPLSPDRLAAAERLLAAVDGRRNLQQLCDVARLGSFEGAKLISEMLAADVVAPVAPPRSPRRRNRGGALAFAGGARLAAALLPFVALLAVVALLWRPTSPAPSSGELRFALPSDPLAEAQLASATRRLQVLVEVHRHASGAWPRDLGELAARGWIEAEALAGGESGPYHYVNRDDGAFVLAPARPPSR